MAVNSAVAGGKKRANLALPVAVELVNDLVNDLGGGGQSPETLKRRQRSFGVDVSGQIHCAV